MARRIITRSIADDFLTLVRRMRKQKQRRDEDDSAFFVDAAATNPASNLDRVIARSVRRAFKKSGLDQDNDEHRDFLLGLLAALIYAGRRRGTPKKWTKKRLMRLRRDVRKLKKEHQDWKELQGCSELIKTQRYAGFEASRLRRVLQDAKKISSE